MAEQKGIEYGVSLMVFARQHGKMQVAPFVNKETGEAFKACVFTNEATGERTLVNFSSNLGELSPVEIAAQKHNLQVVRPVDGKNYILCKQGENAWQDVDLS